MPSIVRAGRKIVHIVTQRLRRQGVKITCLWLFARITPLITGFPIIRYSFVDKGLYVGGQYGRSGLRTLAHLGIDHVVNMRHEFDDAAWGLAPTNYLYLPTVDDGAPTLEHLTQGVAFIQNALKDGGQVYIHCAGGIGRAPTMAAAYLISQNRSVDDALELIKRSRPFIMPSPAQLEQLEHFAAQLSKNGCIVAEEGSSF